MIKKFINKIIMGIVVKKIKENKMIKSIQLFLAGKKTYLAMAGVVIQALVEYAADGDIGKLINKILIAIAGSGMRAGINKK